MMSSAIFLSYASQDADAARRICDALRGAGLEVWFDQSELRGGDAWDASIRKQIKECALFVPIISTNTNARAEGYFRLEWKLAVDRSHLMADDQTFFVPVILADTPETTARVPDAFRTRQWSRLNDESSIIAFATRAAKLADGSASSGINTLGASTVLESRANPQTVSPMKIGEQVRSSSQAHANLDRGRSLPSNALIGGGDDSVMGVATTPDSVNEVPTPPLHQDDSVKAAPISPLQGASLSVPKPVAPAASKPSPATRNALTPRRALWSGAAIALLLVVGAAGWWLIEKNRRAVFIAGALPKLEELSRTTKYIAAYGLAREVEQAGGANALTPAVREGYSREVSVQSTPVGAEIAIKPYAVDGEWITLGRAPLDKIRVPRGPLQWQVTLEGHRPASIVRFAGVGQQFNFQLLANSAPDADMVGVSGGQADPWALTNLVRMPAVKLSPFLIDRTEVSNREFARFVQSGGYREPTFWKHPFLDAGRPIAFDAAMQRFRDATGRPGPATWKLGSYPDGEEDYPVRGISWYEAAAYASFAGKQLPSIHQWYWASDAGDMQYFPGVVLPQSNFESRLREASKVGESKVIGAFGSINMAGNVREWVANRTDTGKYLAVGGSWTEPSYSYLQPIVRSAFDRSPDTGVRCIKELSVSATAEAALAVLKIVPPLDLATVKPASDAEYAVATRFFERRTVALDAKIESTDQTSPHWIRHRVSFAAGYGDERMSVLLYLPRNAKPPYQTLIQMPGLGNFYQRTWKTDSDYFGWSIAEIMIRGGRAMAIPIWKGTYERFDGFQPNTASNSEYRGRLVQWVSELHQTVDYLQSRADIDGQRIGFHGISFGATWTPLFLALEPRLTTGVLLLGGIVRVERTPDISPISYAPRVQVPVLMLNGRDDPIFPYDTSQAVLFKLFGTPSGQKLHRTFAGGHSWFDWYDDMVREQYDWLDKVFGPVTPAERAPAVQK